LYLRYIAIQLQLEKWQKSWQGFITFDEQKAFLAGILHDCAKYTQKKELLAYAKSHGIPIDAIQEKQPGLLHGAVASNIAKTEFDIDDEEILHAIEVHSTGSKKCLCSIKFCM